MKLSKSYENSPSPNFDAVEDIKFWLGPDKFTEVSALLSPVKDPEQFALYASFVGVQGFPIASWYDHINGGGAYDKAWAAKEAATGSDPNGER